MALRFLSFSHKIRSWFLPRTPRTLRWVEHRTRPRLEELESRLVPALIHQWTFNDGSANDSVGTANGTLFNGANIVQSGGQGYLSLDGVDDYMRTSPVG